MAKPTRIAGIDYGMARIGISVSDESKMLASPSITLSAGKKLEDSVKLLVAELERLQKERDYQLSEIVVGLPLMLNGTKGMLADEVQLFVEKLREAQETPVVTWDERLSSVQADRSLMESGLSRKKRSKVVDQAAAVIILQSYLDFKGLQNL